MRVLHSFASAAVCCTFGRVLHYWQWCLSICESFVRRISGQRFGEIPQRLILSTPPKRQILSSSVASPSQTHNTPHMIYQLLTAAREPPRRTLSACPSHALSLITCCDDFVSAVAFSAPPSMTRRDVAMGFGAALASVAGPAFAESREEKTKAQMEEVARIAKGAADAEKDRQSLTGFTYYNPNAIRSTSNQQSTARTASDPNGCSPECRERRLKKYGY